MFWESGLIDFFKWPARAFRSACAATAGALLLVACSPGGGGGGPVAPIPTNMPVTGEVIGTGTIRVALLVPLSANGNAQQIAQNLRNSAALALQQFQGANIQILVKDDLGTADGARAAATEAISQGAELILGPVFAASVTAAAEVARSSGIPIIAFSTDVNVALPNVYLLGFLPRSDVQRIIPFAARNGYTSIAALLPESPYGVLAEAALMESAAASGARVVAVHRYVPDTAVGGPMQVAAEAVADLVIAGQADAVFIPDGGAAAVFLAQTMAARGVRSGQVKYLGSGQWNSDAVRAEATLAGAWYPGPDRTGFNVFSAEYRAAYGATPFPAATLGYDAVTLAAGLAASFGPARYRAATLTSPNGFRGIDGAFRLLANGQNQRTLAVYEIVRGGTDTLIDAAPAGFAAAAPVTAGLF